MDSEKCQSRNVGIALGQVRNDKTSPRLAGSRMALLRSEMPSWTCICRSPQVRPTVIEKKKMVHKEFPWEKQRMSLNSKAAIKISRFLEFRD
jgi:hypothetical protein